MTFISQESSVEASEPREGIKIEMAAVTYRIATGTRDVTINSEVYTAYPSHRGSIGLATTEKQDMLVVRLPMSHAVPQRWLAQGSPPKHVVISVFRQQGANYERIWHGFVSSLGAEDGGRVALLHVPSRMTAVLERRLPTVTVGRSCPHILYDANCRVARASFKVTTTVASVDGRVVTVASMGAHGDDWATFGELRHPSSDQSMTIYSQIGTTITMQAPIVELKVGDSVEVFAGCAHDIGECHTKFSNRVNFGGFPHFDTRRPQKDGTYGIYVSEP